MLKIWVPGDYATNGLYQSGFGLHLANSVTKHVK